MIDLQHEATLIRSVAEEMFLSDRPFLTMIGYFKDSHRIAVLELRHTENDDDRYMALTEAATLVPFVPADEVVMSFDSHVSLNVTPGVRPSEDPERTDAITVLRFTARGMDGMLLPYERPDDERVTWDEAVTNLEQSMIDTKTASIFRHFVQYNRPLRYTEEMMETLSKRGHLITFTPARIVREAAKETVNA